MQSALVTGSDGFIGRHLTASLKKNGIKVIQFSRSLGLDVNRTEDVNQQPRVDVVFHLAAVSGYKDCNANTTLAYKVNIGGTINILNYCRRSQAKLIFPSTYVYDAPHNEYKSGAGKTKTMTHYSMTKWLGEELCRFYSRVFDINTLILRTANVYGPGQSNIYLVPIIAAHLKAKKTLKLTRPDIERSFIYIDDLVHSYISLASAATQPGEVFNVSYPKATTVAELLEIVETVTGQTVKVKYSGSGRPDEINLNRMNITKLKQRLGWQPTVSLTEGLKKLQRSQYF